MTLILDSKVKSMICNLRCNIYTKGNDCAKYEHPAEFTSHKTQVLGLFDIAL